MNVGQLKEALAGVPDHIPVVIEEAADGSGGGADVEYLLTVEATVGAFPTRGRIFIIAIGDPDPQPAAPAARQAPPQGPPMTPEQLKIRALQEQVAILRASERALLARVTGAPVSDACSVTTTKLRGLLAEGFQPVGWVLRKGDRIAIQHGPAIRWKTPEQMSALMHGPDHFDQTP